MSLHTKCVDCGAKLSAEEQEYYGSTCEACEGLAFHANTDVMVVSSPTRGMTLAQRIAHVGGRVTPQCTVEFGSPMAVGAMVQHLVRDLRQAAPTQPSEEHYGSGLDFEPDAQHTITDMANIGRALMDTLGRNMPGYAYNDSPAEIVTDLLNEISDLKAGSEGSSAEGAEPVAYLSSEQLRGISTGELKGTYLPFRKSAEGLFDTPVYLAAPVAVEHPDPRALAKGDREP